MNIYQMYVEYGQRPGFWLVRTTWGNTCARVSSVGELRGRAPYYGNPDVRADIYDRISGEMKDADALLPVPGTCKTWRWVQPPEWSSDPIFDPSAGRVRLYVPRDREGEARRLGARWSILLEAFWLPEDDVAVEKARAKGFMEVPPPPAPDVFFRVPYERRSEISVLGARWRPDLKLWTLPVDRRDAVDAAIRAGFVPMTEPDDLGPPVASKLAIQGSDGERVQAPPFPC